jgi:hypothetical protein
VKAPKTKARFASEVIEGHKGVKAVMVPFDPEEVWRVKPHRLAGRRHGWLVKGTLDGAAFDGYVGERWGNFFITVPAQGPEVGATVAFALGPTDDPTTLEKAISQSVATTQPGKARPDAISGAAAPVGKRRAKAR